MLFHDLETPRMRLRSIRREDRDFLLRQFSDACVCRYLFDEEPMTSLADADALLDFYLQPEPRRQHRWILVRKSDGVSMGTCGFHCWDRETGVCELGYDLYPPFHRQGLMTEALAAVLPFASREMGVRRLEACIYPENIASVRTARKAGFSDSGRTRIYEFRRISYVHRVYVRDLGESPVR